METGLNNHAAWAFSADFFTSAKLNFLHSSEIFLDSSSVIYLVQSSFKILKLSSRKLKSKQGDLHQTLGERIILYAQMFPLLTRIFYI